MKLVLPFFACLILLSSSSLSCQDPKSSEENGSGFKQILTKETFKDWKGDRDYWGFENGVLTGQFSEVNPLESTFSFLVWNKQVKDFELKVDYRLSSHGNSGIYYRSNYQSEQQKVLLGYQADMDAANQWTGAVYENFKDRGHEGLAMRGQVIQVQKDDTKEKIGSTGDAKMLTDFINDGGWNEYHLIVRGNTIIQILNGHVMSMVIDDAKNRVKKGHLGVQLHQGPPMKVEFRNLRLKEYSE